MEELSGFGDLLRQERERLGLSIEQATEATRVRGQILEAFENEDFDNMPPRGYSQNMIGSYAKFLGLDPREIVARYNDEFARFESGHGSGNDIYPSGSGRDSSSTRSAHRSPSSTGRVKRYERPSQQRGGGTSRQGYGQRSSYSSTSVYPSDDSRMQHETYDDNATDTADASYAEQVPDVATDQDTSRYARGSYGPRRGAEAGPRNTSMPDYETYGADESINGVRNSSERHLRSARIGYTGSDDGYSSRGNRIFSDRGNYNRGGGGGISPKTIGIIVGAVVVVILIIVLIRLVACSGSPASNKNDSQTGITQTGATATSSTQTGSTTVATTTTVPFTVTVSLAEGAESNLHVIVDGVDESYAPAVGPWSQTYNVAQSFEIYVYNPDSVTIAKDGETVEIPWGTDANGTACGVLTIDAATQTTGTAASTTVSVADTPAA